MLIVLVALLRAGSALAETLSSASAPMTGRVVPLITRPVAFSLMVLAVILLLGSVALVRRRRRRRKMLLEADQAFSAASTRRAG